MITDEQKPKQPYYDYISNRIEKEREKINNPGESHESAHRMGVYLSVLMSSSMPVVHARRLARLHADLPSFLHRSTQPTLAFYAEATLVDLRNRQPGWIESRNMERERGTVTSAN